MNAKKRLLQGIIKRHPDGFGFFIPDDKEHSDVYIPKNGMNGALTNDRVSVDVVPEGRDSKRFRGTIISIISHGVAKVAGSLLRLNDKYAILKDDVGNWGEDLKIPWDKTGNAKVGQLVTAKITQYPEEGKPFLGEVTEVLGDVADPLNDIKRVIAIQQIPDEFPNEVINQVKAYGTNPTEEDAKGRVDLRGKKLITIDGKTAKDFDDAVLVEMNNHGFKLYVAIADVSHYVTLNTALDKEAYLRGNSVYFPNFVVPMLPEILSNHLCSLNPHVPRMCLVAEMDFDFQGVKTASKFYEAVMESQARVTYGEAQEVIDGNELPKLDHVKETILRCADLAKVLMGKRFQEGSLDLEIPETELIIDAKGEPVDVIRSERLFSHRLIEELMLAANVAVAEFLSGKGIPSLYRIHEPPAEDNVTKLQTFIESFGGKTKLSQGKLQKRISRALEEFSGTPQAAAINTLTLRSMNQAKYSADNVGHFGLGFEFYTHFTSPIRRYSDLIVHRLLKNQIMPNSRYRLVPEDDLATAGTHLSGCEQKAAKAERMIKAIKKARFMGRFLGEEFEGMISSVTKFGVFVVLREYDIDGLVRLEDLSQEHLEFDEENFILSGKRSGIKFQIGDVMKVTVSAVDVEQGQINFVTDSFKKRATGTSDQSERAFNKKRTYARNKSDNNDEKSTSKKKKHTEKSFGRGRSSKHKAEKFEASDRKDNKKQKRESKSVKHLGRQDDSFFEDMPPKASTTPASAGFIPRREGGLSPDEVEAKLNKLRNDPRFKNFAKKDSESKPHKEKSRGSSSNDRPTRKDSEKRSKTSNDRGGVRKARVSKRRGKN